MPDDILGGQGGTLLSAIVIVAVALLALFAVVWLYRRRSPSTFVRGGRARQPRLAVLDAAAVDTRRRIVLIRRDDVEHLVMIGGPTDVVIESRIVTADETAEALAPRSQARREPAPRTLPATDPAPSDPVPQDRIPRDVAQISALEQPNENVRPHPVPPASMALTPPSAARGTGAEPTKSASVAPITVAAVAATALEDEAADILDSARARVFQDQTRPTAEPSSDQPAHRASIASDRDQHPETGRASLEAPPIPHPAPPLGYDEVMSDAESEVDPGQDLPITPRREPASDAPTNQAAPVGARLGAPADPPIPNFEEVLAAELSGDLALEDFGDPVPEASDPGADSRPDVAVSAEPPYPSTDPSITQPAGAPEVQPDTPPLRDSLEDEMARLLGDLTRKS